MSLRLSGLFGLLFLVFASCREDQGAEREKFIGFLLDSVSESTFIALEAEADSAFSRTYSIKGTTEPLNPTRISIYDHLVKKHSRRYGFDWRLISAQICAESNFDSAARSRVGAIGLMLVMPGTAKYLGSSPSAMLRPSENIALGCFYDFKLYHQWSDIPDSNRLHFTFAAYNAGRLTVLRAGRQCESEKVWKKVRKKVPAETRIYVAKIFRKFGEYRKRVLM